MFYVVCGSTSITDLTLILVGEGQTFVDQLFEFPPCLRKLEIDAKDFRVPPHFYECLEAVDSLEEWKCKT